MWKKSASYLALFIALGTAFAACDKSSPTQPTPATCTYSLSTTTISFGPAGGSGTVNVTAASHCTWTAVSDRGWMTITNGSAGTGNGAVNVSVTANPNDAVRTGTLTVAGQSVSVREDGRPPCTIDISPASASFGKDSATGNFAVIAAAECQWTATSNAAWLRVTSASSGAGNATVSYSLESNRDTATRTGTIAVGERTFTVTQSGETPAPPVVCEYSVTPIEFSPCMSVSYTMTSAITTQEGCTWTASPGASWITVTGGQSGSGSGVVSFTVSDNFDAPRHGVVMVRWPTVTAGQNLQVAQAGCRYGVSATAIDIPAGGGTGRFDVLQQSDPINCGGATQDRCRWTAQSDVSWITVTTPMPQVGDNPVSFTVAANPATSPRSGNITVRDRVVRVTQAGR